jgi:hypothetical protein
MARRTGRRDRVVRGIPGAVADNGAGTAGDGRRPECGGAGGFRGTRAEGEKSTGVPKGIIELSGKV